MPEERWEKVVESMLVQGKKGMLALGIVLLCFNGGMAHAAKSKKAPVQTAALQQEAITLVDSINATLQHHRSLRAIQENRVAVEYEKDRAVRGYGPRVDVTAGTGASVLSNVTTRQDKESEGFYSQNRVGATLTQPLWDGFATRSRVRAAEATVDSMTHRVFDNATTLALDTIIAHIDVLRRKTILNLSKDNVARHQEILRMARDRESVGADTMADVSKAESRLARAQTSLVDAEAAMFDAQDTYTRLTYIQSYSKLESVGVPAVTYSGTEAVMEEAKTANPKLAAYLQDINAARAQQQLSQSAYYPAVNLEAGPNYTARGDKTDSWTYSFDVMGVLRWNVFNSGADVAADKASAARVRQARQVMYSYYDDLDLAIKTSWTALASAREQFKFWTEATKFNEVTLRAYNEQFLMGQRSLLDLLDAESELYNSATQAVTAQSNVVIASYRLQALAGVLLPRMNINTDELFASPIPAARDPREKY